MTLREPNHTDNAFWAIVGNSYPTKTNSNVGWLALRGQPILADMAAGREFVADILDTVQIEYLKWDTPITGEMELDESGIAAVNRLCAQRLAARAGGLGLGNTVAIRGNGRLMVTEGRRRPGIFPIDESSNVFGTIAGVSYESYPAGDEPVVDPCADNHDGEVTTGLGLVLRNVKICDAIDYGRLESRFWQAVVPLSADNLRIAATITSQTTTQPDN